MTFPRSSQYNEAIQNLRSTMSDVELREGEVAVNARGIPMPASGSFADVYKVHCAATGNTWAVKCFTREVAGLRERYREISEHLERVKLPFMVDVHFVEPGILVDGQWYPIVKMRWVEGLQLNKFVEQQLDQPDILVRLFEIWLKLAARLRDAGMAHADLQHGNVLLVPVPGTERLQLKLVDYDGMYVPGLAVRPPDEFGHSSYQHPDRLKKRIYTAEVDRFSHLVICCALRCLLVGVRPLWDRFNNRENLLFREADFLKPAASHIFQLLWTTREEEVRALVGRLVLATRQPLSEVPLLDEIMSEAGVKPLLPQEEREVAALLGGFGAAGVATHPVPVDVSKLDSRGESSQRPDDTTEEAAPNGGTALPGAVESDVPDWDSPASSPTTYSPHIDRVPGVDAGTTASGSGKSGSIAREVGARLQRVLAAGCNVASNRWMIRAVFPICLIAAGVLWTARNYPGFVIPTVAPDAAEKIHHYQQLHVFEGHAGEIRSVAFSADGRQVATGSNDRTVIVWNGETGERLQILAGHASGVTSVAFSPDGKRILSGSEDRTAILWEMSTGEQVRTFAGHDGWVESVAFSPDGNQVLTGAMDAQAILWDAASGRQVRTFDGHSLDVSSVAFHPNGQQMLTGSSDQTAALWDIATGARLQTFRGHRDSISSVAFSHDGRHVLTGSRDQTAIVWDAATGEKRHTFSGHSGSLLSVAISSDNAKVLTGSSDMSAILWNVANERPLHVYLGHRSWVRAVAFNPEGRRALTGSDDHTAILWDVAPSD